MKIYTSYYAKLSRDLRGLVPVGVSASAPSWFPYSIERLPELFPAWELINGIKNGTVSEEEYLRRYRKHLEHVSRIEIVKKLEKISEENGGRDVVLLCWESPEKFCHRHIIANWLSDDIEEFK